MKSKCFNWGAVNYVFHFRAYLCLKFQKCLPHLCIDTLIFTIKLMIIYSKILKFLMMHMYVIDLRFSKVLSNSVHLEIYQYLHIPSNVLLGLSLYDYDLIKVLTY